MMCLKHTHGLLCFSGESRKLHGLQPEYPVQENSVQMDPVPPRPARLGKCLPLVKEAEINTLKLAQVCREFWPELAGQQLSFTGPDPLILEWGRSQTHKRFLSAIKNRAHLPQRVL